jgi:hypothetical protein
MNTEATTSRITLKDSREAWLLARANEPEFLEFLDAPDAAAARIKAIERCCDTFPATNLDGSTMSVADKLDHLAEDVFYKFKQEYIAFFRAKLNLPMTAGRM